MVNLVDFSYNTSPSALFLKNYGEHDPNSPKLEEIRVWMYLLHKGTKEEEEETDIAATRDEEEIDLNYWNDPP